MKFFEPSSIRSLLEYSLNLNIFFEYAVLPRFVLRINYTLLVVFFVMK